MLCMISRRKPRVFCELCSQKTPRGILPMNSNNESPVRRHEWIHKCLTSSMIISLLNIPINFRLYKSRCFPHHIMNLHDWVWWGCYSIRMFISCFFCYFHRTVHMKIPESSSRQNRLRMWKSKNLKWIRKNKESRCIVMWDCNMEAFLLLFSGNIPRGVFCEQSSQKTRELRREIMQSMISVHREACYCERSDQ